MSASRVVVWGGATAAIVLLVWLTHGGTRWPSIYCMIDGSMEPALAERDCFVAVSPAEPLELGAIVLFEYHDGEERLVVPRRLAGMPGDTVSMRNGLVVVNGTAQRWRFVLPRPETWRSPLAVVDSLYDWGPWVVSQDSLLVLADRRDMLGWPDSRFLGLIPRTAVFARAVRPRDSGG